MQRGVEEEARKKTLRQSTRETINDFVRLLEASVFWVRFGAAKNRMEITNNISLGACYEERVPGGNKPGSSFLASLAAFAPTEAVGLKSGFLDVYIYVYIYIYIYIHVFIYIYIYVYSVFVFIAIHVSSLIHDTNYLI